MKCQNIAMATNVPLYLIATSGQGWNALNTGTLDYLWIPAIGMPLAILIVYLIVVGKLPGRDI